MSRSIVLPVAKLLAQYKENPNVTMIRHFDLLFIQQSIGKLSSTVIYHHPAIGEQRLISN
jgi:proteasome component ECM29